jgi:RNA polymerase sigma factor (sigma-70 family)
VFGDVHEQSITDGVEQLLLRRELVAALQQLPSQQRAALVLRYFLDLSEKETARELEISVGTVKSAVSRALDRLRMLVAADHNEEARR